ncbi:Protein SHORT HYPOCOTYL IN WHITE LIGHT 1, partial [Mucuna pruriens]
MAVAAATIAPLFNLTRPPHSSKLLHFSAHNVPFYSGFYHHHRLKPIITNCHGKLNSSGEAFEMDEAGFDEYDGVEDESDEDDAESSVDLLIRFLQSMFKKVSKRAKKASRAVLPTVISPQLVSFPFLPCFGIINFFNFLVLVSALEMVKN